MSSQLYPYPRPWLHLLVSTRLGSPRLHLPIADPAPSRFAYQKRKKETRGHSIDSHRLSAVPESFAVNCRFPIAPPAAGRRSAMQLHTTQCAMHSLVSYTHSYRAVQQQASSPAEDQLAPKVQCFHSPSSASPFEQHPPSVLARTCNHCACFALRLHLRLHLPPTLGDSPSQINIVRPTTGAAPNAIGEVRGTQRGDETKKPGKTGAMTP
ncbi:hypothetical protein CCHR01_02676 [Colletotrichum chrysophilum]|uniref:Uncharacterized protein n=1 Tax=Colletotrichum chrysophilum TaxID=1836956 RepID=A0AAD9AXT3_9PEZI|nr:hypothetical protein CCHR01_02676 [Colletotrichum chrysophilum]